MHLPRFSNNIFALAYLMFDPKTKDPLVGVKPQFGISVTSCETIVASETPSVEEIRVDMADAKVESRSVSLITNVGSCVAICLHDSINKCGGLAHVMLPCTNNSHEPLPYKYAETAVPALANSLRKMHPANSCLGAKIAGGANMFSNLKCGPLNIGEKNVQAAREALSTNKIILLGEDVGGTCGRKITFSVTTGLVRVDTLNGNVKKL